MKKRVEFPRLVFVSQFFISLTFLLIFLIGFVSGELDFSVNSKLNGSNGFDTDFYLQTDPYASVGLDYLDFEYWDLPSGNYSFLASSVSGKNLIVDVFPTSNRTIYLTYRINPSISGNLVLSWLSSALGYHYDAVLVDYANDSSYNTSVSSANMNTGSSYSVSHNGTRRYFSIGINYFNFSCGDGNCNGVSRGETCSSCASDCGVCPSSGSGSSSSGGGVTTPLVCIDTSWIVNSTGSCFAGLKSISEKSNCNRIRIREEACCSAETIYGGWSVCSSEGIRTRNVKQTSNNCTVVDSAQVSYCTYNCTEDWSCSWSACQNSFISPLNCLDRNNCGTEDNKPSSIRCRQDGNETQVFSEGVASGELSSLSVSKDCNINFACEEWSECSAREGMEDVKNAQGNLDGVKSRKCVDLNGCTSLPYFEQQKCSLKLYIASKKETICSRQYLNIYEEGTDYLLARVLDERQTRGFLSIQFVLGGKSSEDTSCGQKSEEKYNYSPLENVVSYLNVRKLWGLFG